MLQIRRSLAAPAVLRRLPHIMSLNEISDLFAVAPSPYGLMFKWCASTGMRRIEVCSLRISTIEEARQGWFGERGLANIPILRKGGRLTTLYMPEKLLDDTRWYLLSDRPRPCPGCEDFVFLNERGRPVSRDSLTSTFRQCADRIGSKATLHHLRHTFAAHVLGILEKAEQRGAPMNSLKTLQVLMGHASIDSTEIYLEALDICSDTVMDALDYLYGASP
jgi:integrase